MPRDRSHVLAMQEFFEMGGYAAYVWPAYALSAAAIGGLVWRTWRRRRDLLRRLAALSRDGGAAGDRPS